MARQTYTDEYLTQLGGKLAAAKPVEKTTGLSVRESLRKPIIRDAIAVLFGERGYSVWQVAELLEKHGMKIGENTLRSYLREEGIVTAHRARGQGTSKRRRPAVARSGARQTAGRDTGGAREPAPAAPPAGGGDGTAQPDAGGARETAPVAPPSQGNGRGRKVGRGRSARSGSVRRVG